MNNATQDQFAADVARDLVSKMAPQEIPLFRANSEAYFKDPTRLSREQAGTDDMLGFGAGEAISFLTPIALAVSVDVVKFIAEEVQKSVKAEGASALGEIVKGMFKKYGPAAGKEAKPEAATLTREQLQHVHKLAVAKARQLRLPEAKAQQLADAVISGLVAPG